MRNHRWPPSSTTQWWLPNPTAAYSSDSAFTPQPSASRLASVKSVMPSGRVNTRRGLHDPSAKPRGDSTGGLVNDGAVTTELPDDTAGADDVGETPPWRLMRLLDGYVTTQLLYVAAKLDIASVLADGPKRGDEIAAAVGADHDALVRVMRGLVIEDVLAEDADGRFALTPVGECLASLRGSAIVRGELYYESAAALLDTVLGGGTAFERVHGERFFEHLGHHHEHDAAFEASMAGRAEQEAHDVVEAFDFSGLDRLVDVGGGRGVLLAAILRANPSLFGVLMDREAAISRREPTCRPPDSGTVPSASPATSSSACRRTPMPTCCHGCSTIGTTSMPGGSWRPAATRCDRTAGC